MFHPATTPSQEEVEALVEKISNRTLRFLERRGVITLVTAPGDGEVTVVTERGHRDVREQPRHLPCLPGVSTTET